MEQMIQHLLFPGGELKDQWELFYRGSRGVIGEDDKKLYVAFPRYEYADFYTYLNSCSLRKWKRYTQIKTVKLVLELEGECRIIFAGYSKNNVMPEKTIFETRQYEKAGRRRITFTYPETDCQLVGFEIDCLSELIIFGGGYIGITEKSCVPNAIELAVGTTTMKKEAFITKNVKALYEEILSSDDEISRHFHIHVVDNGRTLKREDFPEHPAIALHPNKNVGGSGGFARGMIEALHQTPGATHVLLMDDDVLVIPDSIYRIYQLLRFMKEKYRDSFIEGAMLYYEDRSRQHEDIGTVSEEALFRPLKPQYCLTGLDAVLSNERQFPKHPNQYGAWWCCCIPATQIEKNGLPLPLFIRGDDAEYGLRCKPDIITMNGICIWHMGFSAKFNSSFDLYQPVRNFFISRATTGTFQNVNVLRNFVHKFRMAMFSFNYNAAELLIRAMEDYLKGPGFISADAGEKLVQQNARLNETVENVFELSGAYFDLDTVFEDTRRSRLKRLLYGLTFNGQRFFPECLLKKEPVYIPFGYAYTPSKLAFHRKLIAINPNTRLGTARVMDRRKFRYELKRFHDVMRRYRREHKTVDAQYKAARKYLTGEAFWRKYLEI